MKTCIIIPAYNEGRSIEAVIRGLVTLGHEIVVVDDGSTDPTAQIAENSGAHVITHSLNLGQGAALQTGIDYARMHGFDVIVTFDADGQHQPSDIPVLLEALESKNADVVLGSRFLGSAEGISWPRKLLLQSTARLMRLTAGLQLTDVHNGLRAFRVSTTRQIQLRQNRMAHASELLQQIARYRLRYTEVPCRVVYTSYSLAKGQKLYHSINIFADLLLRRLHK